MKKYLLIIILITSNLYSNCDGDINQDSILNFKINSLYQGLNNKPKMMMSLFFYGRSNNISFFFEPMITNKDYGEKILGTDGDGDFTVACWEPGQVSPNHCHPEATEIYFCFEGGGTMLTADGDIHLERFMSILMVQRALSFFVLGMEGIQHLAA